MIMMKNNVLLSLIAAFACGLGALVHGESARESFGVDFGNASSTTQEGWTNVSFTATRAGAANTFVNVPLSRNGAASSSSIMAGSLFAMIPMLILYLIFQRQFIEGIALTGGK